jgi:hypothetical protein
MVPSNGYSSADDVKDVIIELVSFEDTSKKLWLAQAAEATSKAGGKEPNKERIVVTTTSELLFVDLMTAKEEETGLQDHD